VTARVRESMGPELRREQRVGAEVASIPLEIPSPRFVPGVSLATGVCHVCGRGTCRARRDVGRLRTGRKVALGRRRRPRGLTLRGGNRLPLCGRSSCRHRQSSIRNLDALRASTGSRRGTGLSRLEVAHRFVMTLLVHERHPAPSVSMRSAFCWPLVGRSDGLRRFQTVQDGL
jgi:hypothetical protein